MPYRVEIAIGVETSALDSYLSEITHLCGGATVIDGHGITDQWGHERTTVIVTFVESVAKVKALKALTKTLCKALDEDAILFAVSKIESLDFITERSK